MEFTASRMDTVCFTGHRPEKLTQSEEQVRSALRTGIDRALRWKYTAFITGMAQGVDLWAAEEILTLRKERPGIKLICAIPYESYADKWDPEWKDKYEKVKTAADEVSSHFFGRMSSFSAISFFSLSCQDVNEGRTHERGDLFRDL